MGLPSYGPRTASSIGKRKAFIVIRRSRLVGETTFTMLSDMGTDDDNEPYSRDYNIHKLITRPISFAERHSTCINTRHCTIKPTANGFETTTL